MNEYTLSSSKRGPLELPKLFGRHAVAWIGLLMAWAATCGCNQTEPARTADDGRAAKAAAATPPAASAEGSAVLLVSHGSHSPQWQKMLLEVEDNVEERSLEVPGVNEVRTAFMEYAEPSIATQLRAFDQKGYQNVIIVPLLLTVSTHSFDDLPTIIGQKEDATSLAMLESEGVERYRPNAKVQMAPLLDFSTLLDENIPRRVAKLSKNPAEEGVVLVAYGSEEYDEEWNSFFRRIGDSVKQKTGVAAVSHAWCGHIVRYRKQPTADAIREMLNQVERVIVIPVLVAYDKMFQERIIGGAVNDVAEPDRVLYVPDAILPEPALNEWIVATTRSQCEKIGGLSSRSTKELQ